jgi:hypothetical protein
VIPLNRRLHLFLHGLIVAVIIFLAIIFSGLSTTSLQTSDGNYRTFTTLGLGGTEFMVLMVSAAFIAVVLAGYVLESLTTRGP